MADKNFKVKTSITSPTPIAITEGGTGQTTANNALNAMLPVQTSAANKFLQSDGTNVSWVAQTLAYERGGTSSRPASPSVGDLYYNTDNNYFESYTANGWFPIAAAPGIPTSVVATNTGSGRAYNNGAASVAFSPATNAGAPSSFIVTPSPTTSPSTFTGSTSPITVTGLASSTQYTYTVQATSPYGTSSASSASSGVTATTVPQAPTINSATGGSQFVSVAFTAGATGGSAITSYTVTSSPGNFTASGATSPITVTGLTDGTAYTFTMTATNANGTSLASSASSSVTPQSWSPEGAYDALFTTTLSGNASSVTLANIPSGYKHLQIRYIAFDSGGAINEGMQFNGDTGTNYAQHRLEGTGASAAAGGYANQTQIAMPIFNPSPYTSSGIIDILDYASNDKYKIARILGGSDSNNTGTGYIGLYSGVWQKTNPITSVTIYARGTAFTQYSSFAVYGVK